MSDVITILLIASVGAYLIEMAFLRKGLDKATDMRRNETYEPTVSIIVAARNEEAYIGDCLRSLINLNFPSDKLEIIVVNDRSSDRTEEIIQSVRRDYPAIIALSPQSSSGNLQGKANALAQGIQESTGEILMFTDADCTVPSTWVRETVSVYSEETGIVGGFTLLESSTAFHGVQALDWICLFAVASGTAGWQIPLTAIGNNFSVRRTAYDKVGGFKNIPFCVTEDYALVQTILQNTSYKLRFPVNEKAVVKSRPCKTLYQLFRQKQRWGVGGLDMVARGILIMSISWWCKFFILIGVFFTPTPLWILVLGIKTLIDAWFLYKPLRKLGATRLLRYIVPFELYYTFYVLVLPGVALLSKNVVWKDRKL